MDSTYAAAQTIVDASIAMLRDAVAGLPDEAVQWAPLPNASSMNVLVMHSITSSRFFLGCGAGKKTSRRHYLEADRVAAFQSKGASTAGLLAVLDAAAIEFRHLLGEAPASALSEVLAWPDEYPEERLTGIECLFRAIGHLREHVGHAQLMRDLWLAGHP
jgi:hypothetical protein